MADVAAMGSGSASRESVLTSCVRAVAIAAILAGIFLRFSGLDRKLFSYDEATTSIRTAGYTLEDYDRNAFDGRVVKNAAFLTYQHADGTKTAADAVRSLALEDPQHPPLYYLLERGSTIAFGDSVAARRIVSATAGTLMLGAVFWLCVELFGSMEIGIIAAALLAVSPFFIIYSQQAREYTVWGLCICVATALLARAMRRKDAASWAWYAVAAALGLYSDLIFAYVLVAHAVYVVIIAWRERTWRAALGFALAGAAAVAAFAPWLLAVYRGRDLLTNNDYLGVPLPAKVFALKWAFNAGATFFDLEYQHVALGILLLPIFALVLYALVALVRETPVRIWLLVVLLGATTALAFLLPDIARHESRSTVARYLLPTWLAIELAVAYVFAGWLQPAVPPVRRLSSALALTALLTCGLVCGVVDARAETTWAEGKSIAGLGPISRIINAAPQPTLVYIADPQRFDFASLALSNELGGDVRIQQLKLRVNAQLAQHAPGTYVLDPTPRVIAALAQSGTRLRLIYEDNDAAPSAIQNLRAETAAVRRSHGEDVSGLSLWEIARARQAARTMR
jgi:uncharacterized membrane protein